MSGIRPTGFLHLGNYFGAVRNYVRMQEEYDGDTVHGTIPEKQAVWDQRIAEAVRTFSGG